MFRNNPRVAQPPGGRSSITFNDGVSTGLPNLSRSQRNAKNFAVPPGGATTFLFDDSASRPRDEDHCSMPRRHTNGLRRRPMSVQIPGAESGNPAMPVPTWLRQPPGGRSSLVMNDSVGPQPPEAAPLNLGMRINRMAPPGGYSSFTTGWTTEQDGNHHDDYLRRERIRMPLGGGGGGGGYMSQPSLHPPAVKGNDPARVYSYLDDASAVRNENAPPQRDEANHYCPPLKHSSSDFGTVFSKDRALGCAAAGALPHPHCHTRIAAPPGGASSFVFG